MSEYRKKITIRVSSQTAYHLEAEAERLGISPGRVVDELMRAAKSCGEVCGICGKHHKNEQISLKVRRVDNGHLWCGAEGAGTIPEG